MEEFSETFISAEEILKMGALELKEYVGELALENPVIDIREHAQVNEMAVRLQKYEWLNSLDEQNSTSYYQEDEAGEPGDYDDLEPEEPWNYTAAPADTLKEYLWSQLITSDYTKQELKIIEYMISCLDSKGYFPENEKAVAAQFSVETETVERLLSVLQGLDPAGIFARNLSECLILQAKRLGCLDETLERIAKNCLDQLAQNNLSKIAEELKLPMAEICRCCEIIRKLNPKPGSSFSSREQLSYIFPDITVVKFKDHFDILLNEYLYPDIRINSYYKQLSKESQDAGTTAYLTDKIHQAEWVRDCIAKRNAVLLEVSRALLGFQSEFFLNGPAYLKPLCAAETAKKLGIQEATVSSAVRGKYFQCTWGIYPLNFLFSKKA